MSNDYIYPMKFEDDPNTIYGAILDIWTERDIWDDTTAYALAVCDLLGLDPGDPVPRILDPQKRVKSWFWDLHDRALRWYYRRKGRLDPMDQAFVDVVRATTSSKGGSQIEQR